MTNLELLLERRTEILAQLAAMTPHSLGGRPNVAMDTSPDHIGAIDHVGYRESLYRELKEINELITSLEGPWEVVS